MRNIIKKPALAALCMLVLGLFSIIPVGFAQTSDSIRVGLFYASTSVSCFTVAADKGERVGYYKNGTFTSIYEEPTGNPVTIRKDSYFVKNATLFSPYSPSDSTIPSGERLGPLHVQIGGSYNSLEAANSQIDSLKKKGINAYPAYTGSFQVWTGFYTDAAAAQGDITGSLVKKLGNGDYKVIQPTSDRIVVVSGSGNTLFIYGDSASVLQVHPREQNTVYAFKINNATVYRGDLEVRRMQGSDMTLIDVLPLEQYLYGVVPSELEAASNIEALKAQAVVCRTYAINSAGKHSQYGFDVCASTHCQVYKGYSQETAATNKAVDSTRGLIVEYEGKPAQVFYFASSGGWTEDSENVWSSEIPYLKGIKDKYESGKSYNYYWKVSYTTDKIKSMLANCGYDVGDILSIDITGLSDSGKVTQLVIKGTKGSKTIEKESCRTILGLSSQYYVISAASSTPTVSSTADEIKAQFRTISRALFGTSKVGAGMRPGPTVGKNSTVPKVYVFTGKGNGHAVGMSQEGAKGMADAGFDYKQILMRYFKGTQVSEY